MAVSSSFSLSLGSQDVEMCTKCPGNSRSDADKYCVECEEYLCSKCELDHDNWAANRRHTLVASYDGVQYTRQTLTETCHLHKGKLIERYCVTHDAVFCSTCEVVEHRACKTESILEQAKGFKTSDEYGKMVQSTKELLDTLRTAKAKEESRTSPIEEIKHARKKIGEHFDQLEADAIQNVSALHGSALNSISQNVSQNVQNIDTLISSIVDVRDGLANTQDVCDAAMFVNAKRGNKMAMATRESLAEIKNQKTPSLSSVFEFDNTVKTKVESISSFGHVLQRDHIYKAKQYGRNGLYMVKLGDDMVECDITDSCLMDDGTILIVDRSNNKLKQLDKQYNTKRYCHIPGKPYGVCYIDNSKSVAVSVLDEKKVQFVSAGNNVGMRPVSSFSVREKCRGIAYRDGELYVSCGGSVGEGAGHIEVYDVCGTFLRAIGGSVLKIPIHIAFVESSEGATNLYVTDSKLGAVVRLDTAGNRLGSYTDLGLKEAKGLCIVNNQHVFATGKRVHNVMQFDKTTAYTKGMQCLLQNADGIKHPCSLVFEPKTSRLIVTMTGNYIRAFALY